jgi:hypothetical protein
MSNAAIVLDGDLRADGTLVLDCHPPIPPGRVRVRLQPLAEPAVDTRHLPDPPWLDDCIPAPFDLPHLAPAVRVQPRLAADRLPDPFDQETPEER